jgi:hypothetical protein
METRDPPAAIQRFLAALNTAGETLRDRRVLILGYGGRFEVAAELLRAGARHLVLVDPYAPTSRGEPLPEFAGRLTVINGPLEQYVDGGGEPVDLVLSNSVLEHVRDVAALVRTLTQVIAGEGRQFHFIDLRDHFFKYPFEMLCWSEPVWRRFLNPGSNLNRWRARDYRRLFSRFFANVTIDVVAAEPAAFRAAQARIRPEFLTGDEEEDALTQVLLHTGGRLRQ